MKIKSKDWQQGYGEAMTFAVRVAYGYAKSGRSFDDPALQQKYRTASAIKMCLLREWRRQRDMDNPEKKR